MKKTNILLVRRLVPDYWEVKNVDGPTDPCREALDWTPLPLSGPWSIQDVRQMVPNCTVLDVTEHFRPTRQVFWQGSKPEGEFCCVCASPLAASSVFIDGVTEGGTWGLMHVRCHEMRGRGLGTGLGQRYEEQGDGRWLKTQG